MKRKEILNQRKSLMRIAGKFEYAFFTSAFLAAGAICAVSSLAVNSVFNLPPVKAAYAELFSTSVQSLSTSVTNLSPDLLSTLGVRLKSLGFAFFERLPISLVYLFIALFLVCPVYQGTIRWSAYLVEEKKPLTVSAVLFYFTSFKLYFSSLYLSIKLFIKKFLLGIVILLPSVLTLFVSDILTSEYFVSDYASSVSLLLSAVLFILSVILWAIACEKFGAVRYLYALGRRKNLFRASKKITSEKRGWLFSFNLRLLLNIFPAVFIITAPASVSRIILGKSLAVNTLINEKRKEDFVSALSISQ